MEITSPRLYLHGSYLRLPSHETFMCVEPLKALFDIEPADSYWIVASSKKPKHKNYAVVYLHYGLEPCWYWSVPALTVNYGVRFYSAVDEILDKHFPKRGRHILYFWILYR